MPDIVLSSSVDDFLDSVDFPSMRESLSVFSSSQNTVSYISPYGPNASQLGFDAIIRMSLSGNISLSLPSSGSSGQRLRYLLNSSGAQRFVSLGSGLVLPSGATFLSGIASGNYRLIELEKNISSWFVVKNLEFIP